jgi:hypothetical protein
MTEYPEPDPSLSRDAANSTYAEAAQEEQVPPLGTATEQTLGAPAPEGAAKTRAAKKASG